MITHPIEPLYDNNSKVLILGSFPSVKSREKHFYYAHPQNRFWKVLSSILEADIPVSVDDKKQLLLNNRIALWDVIHSCEIVGSSDNSIKNVIPNDIMKVVSASHIELIVLNGKASEKYYSRFLKNSICIPSICLPSTSPANANYSLEKLVEEWTILKNFII